MKGRQGRELRSILTVAIWQTLPFLRQGPTRRGRPWDPRVVFLRDALATFDLSGNQLPERTSKSIHDLNLIYGVY